MSHPIWTRDRSNEGWLVNLDSALGENPFHIISTLCSGELGVRCDSDAIYLMNMELTIDEKLNACYRFAFIPDEMIPPGTSYETLREQAFKGNFTGGKKAQPVSSSAALRLLRLLTSTNHILSGDVVIMLQHQSIDQHDYSTVTLVYRKFSSPPGSILTRKLSLTEPVPVTDWSWWVVELIDE